MKKTIEIEVCKTQNGEPTCCLLWGKHHCDLLRVGGLLKLREYCAWTERELERSKNGIGFLIPDKECPIWKGEKND